MACTKGVDGELERTRCESSILATRLCCGYSLNSAVLTTSLKKKFVAVVLGIMVEEVDDVEKPDLAGSCAGRHNHVARLCPPEKVGCGGGCGGGNSGTGGGVVTVVVVVVMVVVHTIGLRLSVTYVWKYWAVSGVSSMSGGSGWPLSIHGTKPRCGMFRNKLG